MGIDCENYKKDITYDEVQIFTMLNVVVVARVAQSV